MKVANLSGRLALVAEGRAVDIEQASKGRFSSDGIDIYTRWSEFRNWAAALGQVDGIPFDPAELGAPSPVPRQVFGVGLNFHAHSAESGFAVPDAPVVFTKFPTCIEGPRADLLLPGDTVDWEVELVAVIGAVASRVPAADAWQYVAGLTAGQDYSERTMQHAGPAAQFSLAKSFPGFGPTGPYLVTPDEFRDPDDLLLECTLNDELMQKARTSEMIFSIPQLIAYISAVCPLLPGDLLFTGTPEGVGMGRTPRRFLRADDVVVSRIQGIGELRNVCRTPSP
jgi:2,4-didehydro-3-deoxy-L-rhamnonate hydrolase